ncbi:hypothetical protein B0F90DRAFT_1810641 [Multifurca ochricompacta]|uniref:WW domain-containing protein n=1 Tax=Multifurca ochricompacta TaxID=376703 RepID=A0AAD4M4G5_9AGAM|nr:hypothetical protein B0F90DRAFT_1810641 [Multifurca ochricompacta]
MSQVEEKVVELSESDIKPAESNSSTSTEATPASSPTAATPAIPSSGNWQAIWSPVHNAYYFYNTITQETTWVNPLQSTTTDPFSSSTSDSASDSASASVPTSNAQEEGPSGSSSGASSGATHVPASVAQIYALQEAAVAQGIDPSLAYLDPSLAGPSAPGSIYNFTARFNAHTGAFAKPDARDPGHLSEFERMKRMSSVYFNMEQWEQEVAQRKQQEDEDAANGKKRKRPSKKDLERFKEQKRLKKIAKTAWLRT